MSVSPDRVGTEPLTVPGDRADDGAEDRTDDRAGADRYPDEPGTGPVDDRSDEELLAAHVAGDPAAFGVLVGRHRDRMWAVALRTIRSPEDAADALQEAFISAYRRAESFRGEAKVTTWMHRIVVNACLDRIRRNASRRTEPLPEHAEHLIELTAPGASHTDLIEAKELQGDIASALATLNADQRAALILVDMEGYSVEEAATMLGCAPGTIKSRCFRGRAKLAPLLVHLRETS